MGLEDPKGYFCILLKRRVSFVQYHVIKKKNPEYCLLVGGAEEQEVTHNS